MRHERILAPVAFVALAVLVGIGLWKTAAEKPRFSVVRRSCQRVMGTSCTLAVVTPIGREEQADEALRAAEDAIRAIEVEMSSWLAESRISALNAAEAGTEVPLAPQTLEVLRAARDAHAATDRAFDITCGPVIRLWRAAPELGRVPTEEELGNARTHSNWDLIELTDTAAVKRDSAAQVDLGGIAKGEAIDLAVSILAEAGFRGGMVDIGGDLRCFGRPPRGTTWTVELKNPFAEGSIEKLRLPEGKAVCTSGNYARFHEIAGRRYSHIIDPRTCEPTDVAASVTVVADDARTADIWATALSVLGPTGFERLPERVEAMIISGTKEHHTTHATLGFNDLLTTSKEP